MNGIFLCFTMFLGQKHLIVQDNSISLLVGILKDVKTSFWCQRQTFMWSSCYTVSSTVVDISLQSLWILHYSKMRVVSNYFILLKIMRRHNLLRRNLSAEGVAALSSLQLLNKDSTCMKQMNITHHGNNHSTRPVNWWLVLPLTYPSISILFRCFSYVLSLAIKNSLSLL